MKKYLLFLVVISIYGCGGKPGDVPPLLSCQITVTNGPTPIAGAEVVLGLTSDSLSCSMAGTTNSSGVATIYTKRLAWQGGGVPAGNYIVTVTKFPKLEDGLPLEEFHKLEPIEQERYQAEQQRKYDALPREVPLELGEFDKSPYRLTVAKGGDNRLEIDIAKTQ